MKNLAHALRLCLLLSSLAMAAASCADDDYHYPSVSLEFLTARSGADGYLLTVQADDGTVYEVMNDVAAPNLAADSVMRIVANYASEPLEDGGVGALLYSAQTVVSPLPSPPDAFAEGIKTDPASVLSIWMGLDYLNLVLEVKGAEGTHAFHFIENQVEMTDADRREVSLTLYHDAGEDPPYYTRRTYLSVPLRHYAADGVRQVVLSFTVWNDAGEEETYTFDYRPA